MPTIPTGKLERDLRAQYLRWIRGLSMDSSDLQDQIARFATIAQKLIETQGGQVARLGALGDFPAPRLLELSPQIGGVVTAMQQAAVQASILSGISSKDAARQMFRAGMDKSYRKLERIARTETVSAYWKNAWGSIADLPALVMVWGSEDGKRTCAWCRERDGLVMTSADLRDHPNGRCTPIPTLRTEVKYRGSVDRDGSIFHDPNWNRKPGPKTVDDFYNEFQEGVAWRRANAGLKGTPEYAAHEVTFLQSRAAYFAARDAEEAALKVPVPVIRKAVPTAPEVPAADFVYKPLSVAQARFAEVYQDKDFGPYSTKISNFTRLGDGVVEFSMEVVDQAGAKVGAVTRTLHERNDGSFWIYHDRMELYKDARGKGFSTAFSQYSEDWYAKANITQIKVLAGLEDGGYVWAKAGYTWDAAYGKRKPTGIINTLTAHTNTPADNFNYVGDQNLAIVQGWLKRFESDDIAVWPTPAEIANAGVEPVRGSKDTIATGKTGSLGKIVMQGQDWYGVKDL